MKKKVWASSPVFFVISAVLLLTAGISWFWNTAVFAAEISIAAVSVAAVLLANRHFKAHISYAVKSAEEVLTGDRYRSLKQFALPAAVVGTEGDIIWVNDAFAEQVSINRDCRGDHIMKFIYPFTMEQILASAGTDVSLGSRQYTVFGIRTDAGSVLYFLDDTAFREISRNYEESRPVVMLASFDNREELTRDSSSGEEIRIASEVEDVLNRWAQDLGGFFKRLSNSRYLILTDEAHLRDEMKKRFPILEAVRGIKAGDRLSATVSVGVARGAKSLQEADDWARNALNMALGRGGDQIAVKQANDTYEFFGGLSGGMERRDSVRTRVFAASISDDIKESDVVFVMGHKYSDLDCVGAAIGMWDVSCKALCRPSYIVLNLAQSLASPQITALQNAYPGEKIFMSPQEAQALVTPRSLLVVVDTHSQDFVESAELLQAASRVVVIDHHRMMVRHIENALVFFHEPYASSTCEMVTELLQYIGDGRLTQTEAEALLSGIMLDTKNFVLKTGARTFEAAAYLRRRGADTVSVKRMFSDSIDAYKAKYKIVSNAEIFDRFAVASTEKEFPDIRIASAQAADELLSIQGIDASFVLFPAGGVINISARSLGDVNVQLIMETLGGGGHLTMAGAQLNGMTAAEARERLIEAIREFTEKTSNRTNEKS
ncbi:DHH family phosphoesterase [Caproicibacter sp. BJN0012]|uniref:DHH family phosphoesterase n=1 Tax=Caproicibacter sp. BJN0012 TaxID=3110227 RepID=UPI002E15267B